MAVEFFLGFSECLEGPALDSRLLRMLTGGAAHHMHRLDVIVAAVGIGGVIGQGDPLKTVQPVKLVRTALATPLADHSSPPRCTLASTELSRSPALYCTFLYPSALSVCTSSIGGTPGRGPSPPERDRGFLWPARDHAGPGSGPAGPSTDRDQNREDRPSTCRSGPGRI